MSTSKRFIAKNGLDNNNESIINVADPTNAQDVATKNFSSNASNITSGTISASRLPAFTGDISSSIGTNVFTLPNTGVTAGEYSKITVNSKGLITSATTLIANDIPSLDWSKITTGKPTTLTGYGITDAINSSLMASVNGVATLDGTGKVPSAQLPSYVDDVLEYANLALFPVTGTSGIIYVAIDTSKIYRWSGSTYIEIGINNSNIILDAGSASSIFTTTDNINCGGA